MNIAIVVGTFPTITETFIVNQIIGLLDKGYKVDILAYRKGATQIVNKNILDYDLLNKVSYFNQIPNSKFKRIQFMLSWLTKNIFVTQWNLFFKSIDIFKYGIQAFSLSLFYKSLWFLSKKPYDIIHVHFGHNAQLIANLKEKGLINKSKLVVSFHGFDLQPDRIQTYKQKYHQLFKQANVFTVNTLYTKNILLEVNKSLTNIHVLPVGLDTNYFSRSSSQKNKNFIIVFCGRLVPFKGVHFTLSILSELIKRGHTNIKLEIIGEGLLKEELIEKIIDLAIKSYVILHGALTQEKVKEIMERSHVFLLPGITEEKTGRSENQGLVIQEAQAMELPVIVSDAGGMKYGLLPNESGFVIKEKDVKGFTNAIEKLFNNESLRQSMGKAGREFVVKNYDNKVLVHKLLKMFMN